MRLSVTLTLIASLIFTFATVNGQEALYSESASYSPRALPKPKGKKQKEDQKEVQKPADAVRSSQLTIPVSVLANERGSKLALEAGDFKIFVDDREVEVISVETRSDPLNLFLLIDTSPSADVGLKNIKSVAHRFVEKLDSRDKVMVFAFNHELKAHTTLTNDRTMIAKAIDRLRMGEGTSLYNAIAKLSEKELLQTQGVPVLVVITDGVDTTSKNASYESSLILAEKTNSTVFPIYFDTLQAVANRYPSILSGVRGVVLTPSGSTVMIPAPTGSNPRGAQVEDYERGRNYLTDLIRLSGGRPIRGDELAPGRMESLDSLPAEIKSRYYVTFRLPTGGQPGERHRIRVRINKPNLTVLAKGSYFDQ